VLPEGTITRNGMKLYIHDGETGGGIPLAADALPDLSQFTGRKISIPFGTGGSTVKNVSTFYYDEVCRVTLPASEIVNGNTFHVRAWTRISTDTAGVTTTNCNFYLVPAVEWDASLVGGLLAVATPSNRFLWKPLGVSSRFTEGVLTRSSGMTVGDTGNLSLTAISMLFRGIDHTKRETAAAEIAAAVDLTALKTALSNYDNAVYSSSAANANFLEAFRSAGDDFEFVVVTECTSAETKTIDIDIKISAR
jgi:hypothetical protein